MYFSIVCLCFSMSMSVKPFRGETDIWFDQLDFIKIFIGSIQESVRILIS